MTLFKVCPVHRSFPGTQGAGRTKWNITTAEWLCVISWETWTETFLMLKMLETELPAALASLPVRQRVPSRPFLDENKASKETTKTDGVSLLKQRKTFFDKIRPSYCAWWKKQRDNWKKKVMEIYKRKTEVWKSDWPYSLALLSVKKTGLPYSFWRSKHQDASPNIADSAISSSMGTAES